MNSIKIVYNELQSLRESIKIYRNMIDKANQEDDMFMKEISNLKGNASDYAKIGYAYAEFRRERRILKTECEELVRSFEALGGDSMYAKLGDIVANETIPCKKSKRRSLDYFKNFNKKQKEKVSGLYHLT